MFDFKVLLYCISLVLISLSCSSNNTDFYKKEIGSKNIKLIIETKTIAGDRYVSNVVIDKKKRRALLEQNDTITICDKNKYYNFNKNTKRGSILNYNLLNKFNKGNLRNEFDICRWPCKLQNDEKQEIEIQYKTLSVLVDKYTRFSTDDDKVIQSIISCLFCKSILSTGDFFIEKKLVSLFKKRNSYSMNDKKEFEKFEEETSLMLKKIKSIDYFVKDGIVLRVDFKNEKEVLITQTLIDVLILKKSDDVIFKIPNDVSLYDLTSDITSEEYKF